MAQDFYKDVPRGFEENLQYRIDVRTEAARNPKFRRAMMTACKHDFLFWCCAFVWLFEPRPRFGSDGRALPKMIPFIPWDHQIPVILDIKKYLGLRDIAVEKSRGEGMSWICILLALHDWLFDDMAKVGLVSNTEKKADDPGNMDSLMAKIDWELTKLPRWMAGTPGVDWTRNKSDHSLVNHRNDSQINAFAATADAGRAGRYKWFGPDELAHWDSPKDSDFMTSISGSTDSRLVISTPNGSSGAYYNFVHTPSNAIRLKLHWSQNNYKSRGLYTFERGVPVAVDPVNNPLPTEYTPPSQGVLDMFSQLRQKGFRLEGKTRSPWYDQECYKADSTPQKIAQELDLDYGGSTYRIFGADFFDHANRGVMQPLLEGSIIYHPEKLEVDFDKVVGGPVKLWAQLDHQNRPPPRPYIISADLSTGLGGSYTSNSVVQVIDQISREQVLEFAVNTIQPGDFADLCISIAKWFWDGHLAWEQNGPGNAFGKRVIENGYANIYYRTLLWRRSNRRTKSPGFWTDKNTKEALFAEIINGVKTKAILLRSAALVAECEQYVRINGKIEHVGAATTSDDSSKGEAHGDRVMSLGVGLMACKERPFDAKNREEMDNHNLLPGTMAYRHKEWEESQKRDNDEWDSRDNYDLAVGRPSGFSGNHR